MLNYNLKSVLSFTLFYFTALFSISQISLVKDISTGEGYWGNNFIFGETLNGYTYFNGQNELGDELWRTDGTPAGTGLFKDLDPGTLGTTPINLIRLNNRIIFTAQDATYGSELWVTDGTEFGTYRIRDINPGVIGSYPSDFVIAGNYVYFIAYMPNTSSKLWRTDGTPQGTILVKDLGMNEVLYFTHPALVEFNDEIYFSAMGPTGFDLWKSDGTVDGTVVVKVFDFAAGDARNLFASNDRIYFQATDPVTGQELWSSDGTASGTQMIKDIFIGGSSFPEKFYEMNGTVFFTADDGIHGRELWKTDGTESGTVLVSDINPGTSNSEIHEFNTIDNKLFFSAESSSDGREYYTSDGTQSGTSMLYDINPGFYNGGLSGNSFKIGNELFFLANPNDNGAEIWKTDGTTSGTSFAFDVNPGPIGGAGSLLHSTGTTFYFSGSTDNTSSQLFISDGTSFNLLFTTTNPPNSSHPSSLITGSSNIYFQADGRLYKSNGTAAGTTPLNSTAGDVLNPMQFYNAGTRTVFSALPNGGTRKLFSTDGSVAGTFPLLNETISSFGVLGKMGNRVVFTAYQPTYGIEPYTTNGTVAGTSFTTDIAPGISSSVAYGGCEYNGYYYFTAESTIFDQELWRTDGTAAGTTAFTSLVPDGTQAGGVHAVGVVNGYLLFNSYVNGVSTLWKTDGTSPGTQVVLTLNSSISNVTSNHINFNNHLYFQYDDGVHGVELWRTDGTAAGTQLVYDINPGPASSYPGSIQILNDTLYFIATNNEFGAEMWRSTGETGNAELFIDLYPGEYSSEAWPTIVLNDRLYFVANNGSLGTEVWVTDGTLTGTHICGDIKNGILSAYPDNFVKFNNQIYFAADDETVGRELWKLNPQESALPISSVTIDACDKYYSSLTERAYYHTAMYIDTLQDINGVDSSILYSYVTIHNTTYSTQIFGSCEPFQWIDGNTYTSSTNTAMLHLNSSFGCDSVITLNLTIYENPDEQISSFNDSLLIASGGYNYQWIRCSPLQMLSGETNDTLIPVETGDYACVVFSWNGCSDTTDCMTITTDLNVIEVNDLEFGLFPNPATDDFWVSFEAEEAQLRVLNLSGEELINCKISPSKKLDISNLAPGTYLVIIETENKLGVKKLVKVN